MRNIFLILIFGFTISNANMMDAVALTVNDEVITLYDIESTMQQTKKKKSEVVSALIDEILFKEEVEKQNVVVDYFELDDYLKKLAAQNGMDLYTFKSVAKQKYKNYELFEENIKQQIKRQKLSQKIVAGKIKLPTENDMQIYYENNKRLFETFEKVHVIQFSSKDKKELIKVLKNPMQNSSFVEREKIVLEQNRLNGKVNFILQDAKVDSFTPIFVSNKQYVSLLVQEKEGKSLPSYEKVKGKIFEKLAQQREQVYLKDYFEKLKLTANIKIIR